jgi:hypothetical protein
MSSSHYTYLGIFVMVSGGREISYEDGVSCPESEDHNYVLHGDMTFCPKCGSTLERHTETRPLDYSDLVWEQSDEDREITPEVATHLEDTFMMFGWEGLAEGSTCLIPQSANVFGLHFDEEEGMQEIDLHSNGTIDPDEAAMIMESDLDILRQFFDVEVKFGYLSQWS